MGHGRIHTLRLLGVDVISVNVMMSNLMIVSLVKDPDDQDSVEKSRFSGGVA